MGVDVRRFSRLLVLLSSLLAACVTAFAGPISFVGIAVPHLVKQLLGSARPLYVLPGCCLGGAAFCLLCDLIARSLFAPMELPSARSPPYSARRWSLGCCCAATGRMCDEVLC